MIILSIETSCDETAIAILEAKGSLKNPSFKILGEALHSQVKLHEQYGGVFPMMAKREHAKNLVPLLLKALKQFNLPSKKEHSHILENVRMLNPFKSEKIGKILERERGLYEPFEKHIFSIKKPKIDVIVVTEGPGLEPTLWVGINFAKALGMLWNIPVIGINHMEGHIASVLFNKPEEFKSKKLKFKIEFPALALLISGGHTELVEIMKWGKYKILGKTRDDAVGEAFDKVARLLELPYPGGPQISALAEKFRSSKPQALSYVLPRPMLHSKDLDFSFSGIKTAVLYLVQKLTNTSKENITKSTRPRAFGDIEKSEIALEFENAVTEVLVSKTKKALIASKAKTIIVAGGVSANSHIQKEVKKLKKEFIDLKILFPSKKFTGDNAVMIGIAGYMKILQKPALRTQNKNIKANGNLSL